MLNVIMDKENKTVILEPHEALSQEDFENVAKEIDPYIEAYGGLKGIIIYSETFPGWDSFSAFVLHLKFVHNHHKKVAKLALVTDFTGADVAKSIAQHFVHAEIKHFPFSDMESAKQWIEE